MSSPQPSFFSFKSIIDNPKMEVRNNYSYFIINNKCYIEASELCAVQTV